MDKVLIADDDVQLLTILSESLEKYKDKFEIVTAKNGLEAILALQKQTFSTVITEIRMPKVNGLVLLGYLTKNFPDLPCIIITDSSSKRLRRQLKKETVLYIEKPFRIPALGEAILAVLARKKRFGGKLNGVSVSGFLKYIESERLTCVCEVSSAKQGKGYLLFNKGKPYNAMHGHLKDDMAVLTMLEMKEATITYGHVPRKRIKRSIYCSIDDISQKANHPVDALSGSKPHRRLSENALFPQLFVICKILSSEYQLYACGKIFNLPRY
jgi:CheY-like chemotaxis protein